WSDFHRGPAGGPAGCHTTFAAGPNPSRGRSVPRGRRLPHDDVRTHPRVNAAHIVVDAGFFDLDLGLSARRNEVFAGERLRCDRQALRGRCLIACDENIQVRDEPAAELVNLGERVELASEIYRLERLTVSQADRIRGKTPGTSLPAVRQLRDECGDRDTTIVDACARAERGVERLGITLILHP